MRKLGLVKQPSEKQYVPPLLLLSMVATKATRNEVGRKRGRLFKAEGPAPVAGKVLLMADLAVAPAALFQGDTDRSGEQSVQCLVQERGKYRSQCMLLLIDLNRANARVDQQRQEVVKANKQKKTVRELAKCMGEELPN